MLTSIMKWVSIVALLLSAFWRSSADYTVVLQLAVCAGAILVVWEAYRTARYLWAIGFAAIAMLFNPIQPLELSLAKFLWLDLICVVAFACSLAVFKAKSRPASSGVFTL